MRWIVRETKKKWYKATVTKKVRETREKALEPSLPFFILVTIVVH